MYEQFAKVMKKDISYGITEGFVLRSWERDGKEYLRVKWDTTFRSTIQASSVLPHTPENRQFLEQKWGERNGTRN